MVVTTRVEPLIWMGAARLRLTLARLLTGVETISQEAARGLCDTLRDFQALSSAPYASNRSPALAGIIGALRACTALITSSLLIPAR